MWKCSHLETEESAICTYPIPQRYKRQVQIASLISDRRPRSKCAYTYTAEIITTIDCHVYKELGWVPDRSEGDVAK